MIRSYWDALRVHDDVLVHDDTDRGFAISSGTVAFVESRADSNGVTVRITDDDGSIHMVQPKRLAVHLDVRDSRRDCWRCGVRPSGSG